MVIKNYYESVLVVYAILSQRAARLAISSSPRQLDWDRLGGSG